MKDWNFRSEPKVEVKYDEYPHEIFPKIRYLRDLIIKTAKGSKNVTKLLETLRWGEPSFIAKNGTTIRINWSPKRPTQYGMYFQCSSLMIPTIKEIYGNVFKYEGTRAIIFDLDQKIPKKELIECILMALSYHNIKLLPRLGR